MNQIYIAENNRFEKETNIFFVSFSQADKLLQILRTQYFAKVTIRLPQDINDKQLRFMMQLSRILSKNGQVHLQNVKESIQTQKFTNLAKKLGLFIHQNTQKDYFLTKTKPELIKKVQYKTNQKLSIGFQPFIQQQIDEDDLLKNQNISLTKIKAQSCAQKPRACANCNCGRKDGQQPVVSKQKLIDSINEGKPVSGCGKCFLGDSFRCGTCPYKGLPAFKPGDKLKMMDQGQVLVQTGQVKVSAGKVKIQL